MAGGFAKGVTGSAAVVALMALGGCQAAKEQIHTRLTSPDGAYEAVLMVCQTPSDMTRNDLVVAVFSEKGRDCNKPYVDAVTGASLTHPYGANNPKATIRWEGRTLVMESQDERALISGVKGKEVTIRLDGSIGALHNWNEAD